MKRLLSGLCALAIMAIAAGGAAAEKNGGAAPFTLAPDLFDMARPDTLGLEPAPGVETVTVFRASEDGPKYNHAAVLFPFKGRLYAQWQSSARDEDSEDTFVAYAVSEDGARWSAPKVLARPDEKGIRTSGGWWSNGETLVAYILVWPHDQTPRGGYTEYMTSTDGETWSAPRRILLADGTPVEGVIEQDMRALADGRIVTAIHERPGVVVAPYYTDDPSGVAGWTRGEMENLPHEGEVSREIEPSWYRRDDGALVMIFRDQDSSFKKLASVSHDRGASWSTPVLTDFPDSRSKQSAGNLPGGGVFQVNNPSTSRDRFPLVVTLSDDGFVFDRAFLIRAGGEEMPPQRYEGKYKRVGYSYPKSVIWKDHLYVAYATGKEDIEVSRIPLESLKRK